MRLGSGHHHRRCLLKRPTSQAPERRRPHSLRPPRMTAPSRPASSHPTMVVKLASHREAGRWLPRDKRLSYVRRPALASRCTLASRYPLRRRHAATFSGADWVSIIAYTSHDHLDARYGADRTHIVGRAHHGRHRAGADGLGRGSSLISEAR